jgi:hypothetical protein
MAPLVVDTEGAAARLGLNPRTLENQRSRGDGPPFVRLGRAIRYRIADLDAYVEARIAHSTAQKTPS